MTITEDKVTHYEQDEPITCPVCGSNNWKLFKWPPTNKDLDIGYIGAFRVACANGCYIDNANYIKRGSTSFDVIKDAFGLIEDDRK